MAKRKPPVPDKPIEPTVKRGNVRDYLPAEINPNKSNPRGVPAIVNSLHQFGAGRSIVVDRDGEAIGGSHTIQAAIDAGITDVIEVESDGDALVVHKRRDLDLTTDAKARGLQIADNRTQVLSYVQDDELVAAMLTQIGAEDARLVQAAGFEESDVRALMDAIGQGEPAQDPGAQVDKAAALAEEYGTAVGQIWQLGRHRLAIGDCTDTALVAELMQGEKADAVVTDPPYGIEREGILNDDPEGLRSLFDRCLKAMPIANAVVIAFQSPRLFNAWIDATKKQLHDFQRMLWMYRIGKNSYPWRGWYMRSDAIIITSIGKPTWPDFPPAATDCYEVNINDAESVKATEVGGSSLHSTIKPIDVIENLIAHTSGLVYEPFAGSGTTLIGCERLNRDCRAIELNPTYAAVAIQRWEALTNMKAERANGRP